MYNSSDCIHFVLLRVHFYTVLFQLEEFLPIYSQCKKDKDQGCYEDFLECLKLYDKAENGLMLGAELTHTLLALGNTQTLPFSLTKQLFAISDFQEVLEGWPVYDDYQAATSQCSRSDCVNKKIKDCEYQCSYAIVFFLYFHASLIWFVNKHFENFVHNNTLKQPCNYHLKCKLMHCSSEFPNLT